MGLTAPSQNLLSGSNCGVPPGQRTMPAKMAVQRILSLAILWILIGATTLVTPPESRAETPNQVVQVIAVVADGSSQRSREIEARFREEILALSEGEFAVEFVPFAGDWTSAGISAALERAYSEPAVDMVLVTGLVANQILGVRASFPKPTFLPLVIDSRLLGLPRSENGSGKPNLNYLSADTDFSLDVGYFQDVVAFRRLGLVIDAIILDAVGEVQDVAAQVAADSGVEIVLVPYSDPEGDLVALIPPEVDAVMLGGLERLSEPALDRLIRGLIERKLPSFSLAGDSLVRRGILTAAAPNADLERLARRTALNIQAVMLGERAEDQPIRFESRRNRFINIETARAIDVWPRFEILAESVRFNEETGIEGEVLDLAEVAERAVEANLDLLAERYGTAAGAEDIREARAALLPQVSAQVTTTELDDSGLNVAAGAAPRSTSGALTVSQLLWSEPNRANRAIQEQLQASREAELEAFRLDTVLAATVAFLDILRSETQLRVQSDNLRLTRANLEAARDRVRVGSASAADTYRWESELATVQQSTIRAYSARSRARENLNRLLHRPLTEPFRLDPPTLDEPDLLLSRREFDTLIDNPRSFRQLMELMVLEGLDRSPELAALSAAVAAKQRELQAARRAFYSPTVSLQGQLSQILAEDRPAGGPSLEGESDWAIVLSGSLPVFAGGARRARAARAEIELQALETRLASTREQLEQRIRSDLHLLNASFLSINLAKRAAQAADKNLELVRDAYAQGVISILNLLDAQNAALAANERAANAVFDFLVDLMNVQRATGRFDFFLDPAERAASRQGLTDFLGSGAESPDNGR